MTWAIGTPYAWHGARYGNWLFVHLSCRCSWPAASLVATQHRHQRPNWLPPTSSRRHHTRRTRPRPHIPLTRRRHRTQRPLLRPQTLPPRRRQLHHTQRPLLRPQTLPPRRRRPCPLPRLYLLRHPNSQPRLSATLTGKPWSRSTTPLTESSGPGDRTG